MPWDQSKRGAGIVCYGIENVSQLHTAGGEGFTADRKQAEETALSVASVALGFPSTE